MNTENTENIDFSEKALAEFGKQVEAYSNQANLIEEAAREILLEQIEQHGFKLIGFAIGVSLKPGGDYVITKLVNLDVAGDPKNVHRNLLEFKPEKRFDALMCVYLGNPKPHLDAAWVNVDEDDGLLFGAICYATQDADVGWVAAQGEKTLSSDDPKPFPASGIMMKVLGVEDARIDTHLYLVKSVPVAIIARWMLDACEFIERTGIAPKWSDIVGLLPEALTEGNIFAEPDELADLFDAYENTPDIVYQEFRNRLRQDQYYVGGKKLLIEGRPANKKLASWLPGKLLMSYYATHLDNLEGRKHNDCLMVILEKAGMEIGSKMTEVLMLATRPRGGFG